jgi:hypothetical protein
MGKDGKVYVKPPFSMGKDDELEEIEEHLKNEHPEAYDAVVESMRNNNETADK